MKTDDTLPRQHIVLIDASSYIFRAYHALPPLTRKSDGLPVGAVSGFCNMIWKLLQDTKTVDSFPPVTHLAAIFDASGDTFRNKIYPDYKAQRPDPPEDLRPQFSLIKQATQAFGLPMIEMVGFEADDLIATYVSHAKAMDMAVTIISSDKDLMQLIGPNIRMLDTMKNREIDSEGVIDKFGVPAEKVIDVQSLAGDSVDNVPGVPGIGLKTAAILIKEYGSLDNLLERAHEIKQNKRRENLLEFADLARISRQLVTLRTDVPVTEDLESFHLLATDGPPLISFLKAMELSTLTRRVAEATMSDPTVIDKAEIDLPEWVGRKLDSDKDIAGEIDDLGNNTAQKMASSIEEKIRNLPIDRNQYEIIHDEETLKNWVERAFHQGYIAVDSETTSLDAMEAELVGISLALEPGKACYIPFEHKDGEGDLLGKGRVDGQLDYAVALPHLKQLLESEAVLKIGQNFKYDRLVFKQYGMTLTNFDDTMLISYVLDGGRGGNGMDELSERWLDHKPIAFKDIAGTGKKALTFDFIPLDIAATYAAEDADITLRLWLLLKPRLTVEKMVTVYERLERPMVSILCDMERHGVKIDRQVLARLSGNMAQKMASLEIEIYELAGEKFNISSPKQLGEILFDKMALPGGKKTKTGAWATGADVLEAMAVGHDLPVKILEWRQLAKLKSTYTDALPEFIHPQTGRVHTSYALAATSTGRLSSSEPNLQNIPIRSEEGRKIRTAFVAEAGHQLLSADYSQIELRVLAHVGEVKQLCQAFDDGLDIHAMTASEMFHVPIKEMDPMIRRRAKAINFGIIYGISAFGLANQLGISRTEAKDYIDTYFERFRGIHDYMEETKKYVHKHGYVETIFGRKAHYPDIGTKNPNMRAFYERAAINAPIQGSAADIIRRAMIRMPVALKQAGSNARMLLQVHDELIFEVSDDQADSLMPLVIDVMEKACEPTLSLSVPLKVDAALAVNWDEAH